MPVDSPYNRGYNPIRVGREPQDFTVKNPFRSLDPVPDK